MQIKSFAINRNFTLKTPFPSNIHFVGKIFELWIFNEWLYDAVEILINGLRIFMQISDTSREILREFYWDILHNFQ